MTDFEARAAEIAPCTCGAENLRRARNELADLPCDDDCPSRLQPAIAAFGRECDKAAREECAEVADRLRICSYEYLYAENVADAIRATIPQKDTPDE